MIERYAGDVCPHSAHQTSSIVPIHGTLSWVACTSNITLPPKQDWVDQWLRFVEVVEQKSCRRDEGEEYRKVVSDNIIRNARHR